MIKFVVKELLKAKANPKNITNVMTERKGISYNAQDVKNIVARIKTSEQEVCSVEESLGDINIKGGDVRYTKQSKSDNVEVFEQL